MRETGGKSPVISRIYVSGRCKGLLVEFRYEVAASALSHFPRTTRGDTASRLVSTRYLGLLAGTRIVEERIKAIFGVRSVLRASLLVGLDKVTLCLWKNEVELLVRGRQPQSGTVPVPFRKARKWQLTGNTHI